MNVSFKDVAKRTFVRSTNQSLDALCSDQSIEHGSASVEQRLFFSYISGFVDGEGCFSFSLRRVGRIPVGVEITPSFSIGQNNTPKNYALLQRIRDVFQGGSIRSDRKRAGFYKYETRSIAHIQKHVIPFFVAYPLHTEKKEDFQYFCKVCSLIAAKQHTNSKGLLQILDIVEKMNLSGTRRYSLSELRSRLKGEKDT